MRWTRSPAARAASGPDVSRGGVQRDILPIIEGSTVMTKYGPVRTDHVLFIAAGAFHMSQAERPDPGAAGPAPDPRRAGQPAEDDFRRILTEPQNALTKQYAALLATEGVTLEFTDDGIAEIARIAADGQRADREHRRAPPAHDDGALARGPLLRGPGRCRAPRRAWTPPTSASASPRSSRIRTCRGISSEPGVQVFRVFRIDKGGPSLTLPA